MSDRNPGKPRARSLYYYENVGLQLANGEWILITNDDTRIEVGTGNEFEKLRNNYDVIALPSEIDNKSLGKRAPILGTMVSEGEPRPILLLDFALIRAKCYQQIGPMDENLDWYGGGLDRGIRISLIQGIRQVIMKEGGLTHELLYENRRPPHAHFDFKYLRAKWESFQMENTSVQINVSFQDKTIFPIWFLKHIWPKVSQAKRILAQILNRD
jgi:hypothetical protein